MLQVLRGDIYCCMGGFLGHVGYECVAVLGCEKHTQEAPHAALSSGETSNEAADDGVGLSTA